GALDFSFGLYRLALTESPALLPGSLPAAPVWPGASLFTLATFNLENLFDTVDDPDTQDTVLSPAEYQRRLQKRALAIHADLAEPTLLAVQEAENLEVLQALIAREEILADYVPVLLNGPDARGLDVALLYRPDQISLLSYRQEQGCTALIDGLGPDGNSDVQNPQNAITCDSDGDGILDGNRLFSRPPLVVQLNLALPEIAAEANRPAQEADLWVIVNHWKSKLHDSATQAYTLPRRLEQAQFVASLVSDLRQDAPGANILVAGDLNDNPDSAPLEALRAAGLRDLTAGVGRATRYSYIYQGVSLQLDYLFALLDRRWVPVGAGFAHLNADYPAVYARDAGTSRRSSDHDPFRVGFLWHDQFSYLPIVATR
ncbi:MAG TPA: endonuclease/exonuclease/phosphatase family protein, partial [Anaerolineales bacterium]|nr:endonuclease/exonuclease/phosphatase family protein [Anaerolineales bacterium]